MCVKTGLVEVLSKICYQKPRFGGVFLWSINDYIHR